MLLEATHALWDQLRAREELSGFILIGGSALALRISHRRSEDLDFAWPHGKLPRAALAKLLSSIPGTTFNPSPNEAHLLEAAEACLDPDDYQQDYVANGVKVTFFSSGKAEAGLLARGLKDPVRVAEISEIFALKALACADRSKSRDWFDLYVLFRNYGYTWNQFHEVLLSHSGEGQYRNASGRLCSGVPSSTDEGFKALADDAPSAAEMGDFFREIRNRFEENMNVSDPET